MSRPSLLQALQDVGVVVSDLDFTLTNFGPKGRDAIFDLFERFHFPERVLRAAFARAEKRGFTFTRLRLEIEREVGERFGDTERKQLKTEFSDWLTAHFRPYDDVLPVFGEFQATEKFIGICTHGETLYQIQKIMTAQIPHDEVRVVRRDCVKHEYVRRLRKRFGGKILFLEDKPPELDAASEIEGVVTVLVRRPESPHVDVEPKRDHYVIRSLRELLISDPSRQVAI
ncbi:MAG: hypothetical protein WCJ29_05025 [bacterium]